MKVCVFGALLLMSGSALALDLKGVRLGMTMEELKAAFPAGNTGGRPLPNGTQCYTQMCAVDVGTVAGIPMQLHAEFLNGKIANVYSGNFSPGNFDHVVEALKSKYGAPTSTSTTKVQNRLGNAFENAHDVWKLPDGELRVSRFMPGAPTLDIAELRVSSKEWLANEEAERAKRNSDL